MSFAMRFLIFIIIAISFIIVVVRLPHMPSIWYRFVSKSWYSERLNYIGLSWCREFIDKLNDHFPPDKLSIRFISPSANSGVYEKQMYRYWLRIRPVHFICSDITKLSKVANCKRNQLSTFEYLPQKNATDISSYCQGPVDIIFDMKGALWHLSSAQRCKLLYQYFEVLNPKGYLILDNDDVSGWDVVKLEFKHLITRQCIRKEKSTMQRLGEHSEAKKLLNILFPIQETIVVSCDHGETMSFILFQKN